MARELSDGAVRDQAEAFLSWSTKRGNDYLGAFKVWAETKDFSPEDYAAIARVVRGSDQGAA